MADSQLTRLGAEAFTRVLCVAAHPDDMEYGASAAVAAWTAAGVEVHYLLLTRGGAGIDTMSPAQTAEVRSAEQTAACEAVGVKDVEFLDHPDGVLEYGLGLRRDIARAIRRVRPDAVVTGPWDLQVMDGLNQADHRAAGLAALDAVRDAGNRWVFHDLVEHGLEPHSVRWLLVVGHDHPTHGVDVTGAPMEAGIRSLEAHAAYLSALPWHPPAREVVEWITAAGGPAIGTEYAVLFRLWDLQAPPSLDEA